MLCGEFLLLKIELAYFISNNIFFEYNEVKVFRRNKMFKTNKVKLIEPKTLINLLKEMVIYKGLDVD